MQMTFVDPQRSQNTGMIIKQMQNRLSILNAASRGSKWSNLCTPVLLFLGLGYYFLMEVALIKEN